MDGPDHKASLNPTELTSMINAIRNVEVAMGDGEKKPSISEIRTDRKLENHSLQPPASKKAKFSYRKPHNQKTGAWNKPYAVQRATGHQCKQIL